MARPTAEVRLARLLSVIPWVVERQGATIDEIGAHFSIPEAEVLSDLSLVQCCEIPPYGPDHTLGIVVIDDTVMVEPGAMLDRPLRLGPQEAFGLLAAGRAAAAVLGDRAGALATALEKLESALGERSPVEVDLDRPEELDVLQEAVDTRRQVEIDYYTASRDVVTTRRVDPVSVLNHDGDWFLHAYCHRADAMRTFRIDRIDRLETTDVEFERPTDIPAPRVDPGHDGRAVRVRLPRHARWITEAYPMTEVIDDGDDVVATFAIVGDVFLERVMLRAGAGAEVLDPEDLRDLGPAAASRLLERYS